MLIQFAAEPVLEFHDFIIARWGGSLGVINMGGLESALARPFLGYHHTTSSQTAALMHALIKNHPFVDGNKRTAVGVTLITLDLSGIVVMRNRQFSRLDDIAESIANNRMSERELETYFRRRIKPKHPWAHHGAALMTQFPTDLRTPMSGP